MNPPLPPLSQMQNIFSLLAIPLIILVTCVMRAMILLQSIGWQMYTQENDLRQLFFYLKL